jgi:hypothetical protein
MAAHAQPSYWDGPVLPALPVAATNWSECLLLLRVRARGERRQIGK